MPSHPAGQPVGSSPARPDTDRISRTSSDDVVALRRWTTDPLRHLAGSVDTLISGGYSSPRRGVFLRVAATIPVLRNLASTARVQIRAEETFRGVHQPGRLCDGQ